ncbi:MAG: GNAT family N-acetyltransferase [Gemmatimonadales bacterium]|jgi:predicted GNAT family acetyltransferase
MEIDIRHDEAQHKFVAKVDGNEAHLTYTTVDDETLEFRHTFVPSELRGRKLARQLVDAGFAYAREHGYTVIPTCSYVAKVVERTPAYQELVAA